MIYSIKIMKTKICMYEFWFVKRYYHEYNLTQSTNSQTKYWYNILAEIVKNSHEKMVLTIVMAVLFHTYCTTKYYSFERLWWKYAFIESNETIKTKIMIIIHIIIIVFMLFTVLIIAAWHPTHSNMQIYGLIITITNK